MGLEEFERITLPEEGIVAKCIQLEVYGEPFLRSSKGSCGDNTSHGNLLEDTLKEFRIDFMTKIYFYGRVVPLPFGEEYELIGAGLISVNYGTVNIGGSSMVYNIKINQPHLERIKIHLPEGLNFTWFP